MLAQGWRGTAQLDGLRWKIHSPGTAGSRPAVGRFLALGLLSWFSVVCHAADVDDARIASYGAEGLLRWENIEGAPYWRGGVPLKYDFATRLHLARLAPGDEVHVHVPAGSLLRVTSTAGPLCPGDIELWVANGSGLYRRALSGIIGSDGSLLSAESELKASLVRVVCPKDRAGNVTVALFLSRRLVPDEAFSYACEWLASGGTVKLTSDGKRIGTYRRLSAGQSQRLQVMSPARLRIESRLIYDPREAESHQSYQLRMQGDLLSPHTISVLTRHESRHAICIDGVTTSVGEHEVEYIDLPAGNQYVDIESTSPVIIRITAAPCQTAYPASPLGQRNTDSTTSIWDFSHESAFDELQAPDYPAQRRWRLAQRVARDNRYADGGIQAWNLLRQLAVQAPAHRALSRWVHKAEAAYTAWREPGHVVGTEGVKFDTGYFVHRGLLNPQEEPLAPLLTPGLIDDSVASLAHGHFVHVPPGGSLVYELPDNSLETQIRIAVDRRVPLAVTPLTVQYDSSRPIPLQMVASERQTLLEPSLADAGLSALHSIFGTFDAGTLGGPFAARRSPAALIDVATVVLNTSLGTQRIRLTNHASHTVRICLHFRASREVGLSESAFLAYLNRQPDFSATLLAAIGGRTPTVVTDREAFEELRNHVVPFVQRLETHRRAFQASVAPLSRGQLEPQASPWADEAQRVAHARELTEHRQWVAALEAWTQITDRGSSDVRQEAIARRVEALTELGESYLAETELRGRILYDPDQTVRRWAKTELADRYRSQEEYEALQRLMSTVLLTDPSVDALADVAEASALNCDWHSALMAGLGTAPELRSSEILMQATYQMGWWQVFDRALGQLADPQQRQFWLAMSLIRQGNFGSAVNQLKQAGTRGQAWQQHVVAANQIVDGLRAEDPRVRLSAMREWEQWMVTHPGQRCWQRDRSAVVECAQIQSVLYDSEDVGTRLYRGSPQIPVRLRVAGPIELRIQARPIHNAKSNVPLNDWIIVRGTGREVVWPLTSNRPADRLRLDSTDQEIPGMQTRTEVRLGPGIHELEIAAERSDILVDVAIRRPLLELGLLPAISPATIQAIVGGRWGRVAVEDSHGGEADVCRLAMGPPLGHSVVTRTVEVPLVHPLDDSERLSEFGTLTVWESALLALRQGELTQQTASELVNAYEEALGYIRRDELLEIVARAGVPPAAVPHAAAPDALTDWTWMYVFQGRLREALRIDPGSDPISQRIRASLLTRLAELDSSSRAECGIALAELVQHSQRDDFTARQLDRVKEPGEWMLFREVESSSGLYSLADDDPEPLGQAAQVRHALAAPVGDATPADYLLTGYRGLALTVTDTKRVNLELVVRQPQLSFLPSPDLLVDVHLDGQFHGQVHLSTDSPPQRYPFDLRPGKHYIQLRIVNPFAGHYVFINVLEVDETGSRRPWRQNSDEHEGRLYHVASPSTPVKLVLRGPAWIRVERWVNGQSELGEMTVEKGDRQVTLAAPPGAKRALYRIWEYRFGEAAPDPPPYTQPAKLVEPVTRWLRPDNSTHRFGDEQHPSAMLTSFQPNGAQVELAGLAPADFPVASFSGTDAFPLGGYEDGTWGLSLGLVKRRALEEGQQLSGDDRFLQSLLSYNYYDTQRDTYVSSSGLFRLRDKSGPSFGLRHEYWTPIAQLLDDTLPEVDCDDCDNHRWYDDLKSHTLLSGFVQHPEDPLPFYDAQVEGSLGMRSRIYYHWALNDHWYHLPSVTLIARWLSLDTISYEPSRIDQDVFTPFKNDHRLGFYLTDTWIHEPVEYGRVWLRPAVYTNEDLNPFRPDHVSAHVGLSAMRAHLDWQLAYRYARFFKDDDRKEARSQHLLYLDAVVDHWQHAGHRMELSVSVRYELDDGETSAYFTMSCFRSRGRGYRDHHPSDVGFRSLRERYAFSTWQFFEPLAN